MDDSRTKADALALGERVRAARESKDMSVAELAALADVSKAYIHQIETGDCPRPSAHHLFNVATILDTSVGHLLGRIRTATPEPATVVIPESLRKLAESEPDLTEDDVEMLARIKHRNSQPKTIEDWKYLWESIKRTVR